METLKKYWWLWLIIALLLVWYFWPKVAKPAPKTTGNGEKEKLQKEYSELAAQRDALLKPYVGLGYQKLPADVRLKLAEIDKCMRMNEFSQLRYMDVIYTSNYQTNVSPHWWL